MQAMALLQENNYTIEDINDLPEGQRAELIDGKMYAMSSPGSQHQRISRVLLNEISYYIARKGGPCEPYHAPFSVFLNADNRNYVEPDISVICDPGKINGDGCVGAPDWIIEIVSPGSRQMDYSIKLFKYRNAGVREYWIVDWDKKRVFVYYFENDEIQEYGFSDRVKVNIYEDLFIDFSKILPI